MKNYVFKKWFKGKEHRKFKYPDDIDEELVPMLDVFNNIPGMRTEFCCCGHNQPGWYMVFKFTSDFMYDKTFKFFKGICNSECDLGLDFKVIESISFVNIYGGVPESEIAIYCDQLGMLPVKERAKKYSIICKYFSQFAIHSQWGKVQEF